MKNLALLLLALALCWAPRARGDEPAAAPPAQEQAPAADAPKDAAPAAAPEEADKPKDAEKPKDAGAADLSFDLLDDGKKPQTPAQSAADARRILDIDRQVKLRRSILITHQTIGFVTLAALAATVIVGHLNYADKYTSGDFSTRYEKPHLGLAISTTGLFATTGILALAAPNPYPKPIKFDTALIHKLSMAVATAGMVAQIIMGPITDSRAGRADQAGLALGHVITGYATFAFMATGVITYMF